MDYKADIQSDDEFDSYSDSYQQSNGSSSQHQFNTSQGRLANPNGLSKAELRKTNKPIMEKRRRARINHCLNELKSLILEAMKKDPARHTKLEKADILEMTVKHLQSVQRQQLNMALQTDPTVIHKFKTGFVECTEEVNRYVAQLEGVDEAVRQRLSSHLNNCATGLEQIGSMTNFNNGYRSGAPANLFGSSNVPSLPLVTTTSGGSMFPALPQELNNNSNQAIQMGGVKLIPSRLPSGEFALIVPNTNSSTPNSGLLNSHNSQTGFPAWPTHTVTNQTTNMAPINDFAANFKRLSAFQKPHSALITPPKTNPSPTFAQTSLNSSAYPVPATHHQQNPHHHPHQHQHHQQQQQQTFHSTTTTSPPLSPISSVSSHNDDSLMHHNSSEFINSRSISPRQEKHANSFLGVFATPPSSNENSFVLSSVVAHLQQPQVTSTSADLNSSSASSLKRSFSETADSSICSDDEQQHASKKYQREPAEAEEDHDSMWRPW